MKQKTFSFGKGRTREEEKRKGKGKTQEERSALTILDRRKIQGMAEILFFFMASYNQVCPP